MIPNSAKSRRGFLFNASLLVVGTIVATACSSAPAATSPSAGTTGGTHPTAASATTTASPTTSQSVPPTTAATVQPTTAPAAKPTAQAATSAAGGSFTYFNYEWENTGVGLANRWIKPADAFEKATGIKVNRQAIPSTQYWDKMLAELASGTKVELWYGGYPIEQYIAMGGLSPLDPYVDVKALQSTFYPAQKENLVSGGQTYGFLCGLTSSAMFYNKDIFDKAGLKPPTTYDELLATAKKLTKAPDQYGMGIPTADQIQVLEPVGRFLIGYDTLWGNGKEVLANSPKTVQAISALKGLVDAGVTPANQNNPVLRPMFWTGKTAIWWDGPWFPGMSDKPIPGLATAKIPLPSGKTSGGIQTIIMAKGGANKEAAGKYLDFISQPQWQKVMTEESGIQAGRTGIDYSDYLSKNPWYQAFLDAMPGVVAETEPGWEKFDAQVKKIAQSKISEMYAKNRPVKQVLDEMQSQFEQLVKQNLS
ncbi:MAG TPA: sugar ABC transporter substrate-binding protein [Chloroflexota bacterium]|nr:sugar ABC transporter substrate-binding protein [Chloroflexota bacterium]